MKEPKIMRDSPWEDPDRVREAAIAERMTIGLLLVAIALLASIVWIQVGRVG